MSSGLLLTKRRRIVDRVVAHDIAQVEMGWSGIVLVTRPVTSVLATLTPAAACGLLEGCKIAGIVGLHCLDT